MSYCNIIQRNMNPAQVAGTAPASVAPGPSPNFDALATSVGMLSAAFAFGSILLAIIALIGGFGWGFHIRRQAQEIAKSEAQQRMDEYLQGEGLRAIRAAVQLHTGQMAETTVVQSPAPPHTV